MCYDSGHDRQADKNVTKLQWPDSGQVQIRVAVDLTQLRYSMLTLPKETPVRIRAAVPVPCWIDSAWEQYAAVIPV
jgi:hypothetical protein